VTGCWSTSETTSWNDEEWSTSHDKASLPKDLFEDVYTFSFDITNTGDFDAHEVPQAYLAFPHTDIKAERQPPKVLRKFERVYIKKGETKTITWTLNRYDFSIWRHEPKGKREGRWIKPDGNFKVLVGKSSRRIERKLEIWS
jgi:hypothetical protein